MRFLLVQTQTHSATAAVESMDSWSTARPPAPARPATLGSHSLRRGRGKGSMALSLVQASFLTPSASNHLTWQDTRPASLSISALCCIIVWQCFRRLVVSPTSQSNWAPAHAPAFSSASPITTPTGGKNNEIYCIEMRPLHGGTSLGKIKVWTRKGASFAFAPQIGGALPWIMKGSDGNEIVRNRSSRAMADP